MTPVSSKIRPAAASLLRDAQNFTVPSMLLPLQIAVTPLLNKIHTLGASGVNLFADLLDVVLPLDRHLLTECDWMKHLLCSNTNHKGHAEPSRQQDEFISRQQLPSMSFYFTLCYFCPSLHDLDTLNKCQWTSKIYHFPRQPTSAWISDARWLPWDTVWLVSVSICAISLPLCV